MNLLLLICISLLGVKSDRPFELRDGDLIFQEECSVKTDNTIKAVTSGIGDYKFTHVGIVYIDVNDSVYVIEATHPKVKVTPLQDYLYPKDLDACFPVSVVGRLKPEYRLCIPQAIEEGLLLVDKDYDYGYVLNNDKYYCSELIYHILLKANEGKPVFALNVMTFKSPDTGEITKGWEEYFGRLGLPIPEGELGINPGVMSRSDVIDIIHKY